MGVNITWHENDGVIFVQEYEEVSDEDFARSMDEIRRLSKQTGCLCVLVDTTGQTTATDTFTVYERGVHAVATLNIQNMRVAILVAERLREPHEFFETVASNRGFSVHVFDDKSAALVWLDPPAAQSTS